MLPRTMKRLSMGPTKAFSQSMFPIASHASSITLSQIHTKKQASKPVKSNQSNTRWFTAIPLPSLTAMTDSFSMLTGSAAQSNNTKTDRIMQRVWEKRKQRLFKATSGILEKFQTKNINFETAEIYIRKAGSFDDSEDNAQRDVHIALRGIAHTVVVLKCGKESYLLDRVVEGIRLSELSVNESTQQIEKCNKFKPEEMVKLSTFNNVNLSSKSIAQWINEESQTQYSMIKNSCVHFSFYFYQHFLVGLKLKQFMGNLGRV